MAQAKRNNYYFIKWEVFDGEHEYYQVAVLEATNIRSADKKAKTEYVTGGYKGDYRGFSDPSVQKITQQEYETLKRFI